MELIRTLESNETADPNIHLGICGQTIPFEKFRGIYNKVGARYTSDIYNDKPQFRVVEKGQLILETNNTNNYVLEEDLRSNDKWLEVGLYFSEFEEFPDFSVQIVDSRIKQMWQEIVEKYSQNQTGEIGQAEKIWDAEGNYMWKDWKFNTWEGCSLQERIYRHADLLYRYEPILSWTQHWFEMLMEQSVWNEFKLEIVEKELEKNQILAEANKGLFGEVSVPVVDLKNLRQTQITLPGIGHINARQSNKIKDFILIRKDNE